MQRPQLLALQLENDFECVVLNKKFICGKRLAQTNRRPKNSINVLLLPKGDNAIIGRINEKIYAYKLRMAKKYDAIWICHPTLYKYVPEGYDGKIIYDCMDNHVAMAPQNRKEITEFQEASLIKRADLIFVTSDNLKKTVKGLENAVVVRNGYHAAIESLPVKSIICKDKYDIGYFGTISTWFDIESLDYAFKKNGNFNLHIIGPIEENVQNVVNAKSEYMLIEGVVEHSNLSNMVCNYDALIMPFVVNDIILSVDPVKLYEYINFGKCIISVWYPEIERFAPFVYFYKNKQELSELLKRLSEEGFPPKYDAEARELFLMNNTWDSRYEIIKKEMRVIENDK